MAYHNRFGMNGRFGNQLFQLAATYAHSRRMNEPLYLPNKWDMDAFFPNLSYKIRKGPVHPYREPSFNYTPIPRRREMNLEGYFQSVRYFEEYESEIRHILHIPGIENTNRVAIHVRRGDYTQLAHTHTNLTNDYYERAIAWIKRMQPGATFKIFSDDIYYCMLQPCFHGMEFSDGKDVMADFKEMIGCRHHIIANSSFSWWTAWLSNHPDKVVIAPFHWFSNWRLDYSDIHPPEWLILNAGKR